MKRVSLLTVCVIICLLATGLAAHMPEPVFSDAVATSDLKGGMTDGREGAILANLGTASFKNSDTSAFSEERISILSKVKVSLSEMKETFVALEREETNADSGSASAKNAPAISRAQNVGQSTAQEPETSDQNITPPTSGNPLCGEKGHTKMGSCDICWAFRRCDYTTGPGHTEQGNCHLCHLTLSFCRGPGHWENGTCANCGSSRNCDLNGLGHAQVGQCPTCSVINGGYFEIGEGGGAPGIGW